MLRKIMAISAMVIVPTLVNACKSPDNEFAIFLTDGESVDLSTIERLGEDGVSFFKEEITPGNMQYSFRSHYNHSIMVSISTGAINFTVDTSVVNLSGFPFGTCAGTELSWLVEAGILAMDRIDREKIEQDFYLCGRGSYIFWTKQDTLMHSSWALSLDGTFLPIDCVGPEVAINLPPEDLEIATNINKNSMRMQSSALKNMNKSIYVDICGRKVGQKANLPQVMSSVILIQYDAASGVMKRTLTNR